MTPTRDFHETVTARAAADADFARALLAGGAHEMLAGDLSAARALMRDYADATVGVAAVAQDIGSDPERVAQLLGPEGNPSAAELFAIVSSLQRRTGVTLDVSADVAGQGVQQGRAGGDIGGVVSEGDV